MKNAPSIDIPTLSSAAPSVGQIANRQRQRVERMAPAGSTMEREILGQKVHFILKEIPAERVERATMVWAGNERDQELLTETSLGETARSIRKFGQEEPAIGRDTNGIAEVADGSCRRKSVILANRPFFIWIGELNDKQMEHLSKIGNQYQAPSPYEKGLRYLRLLNNMDTKALAESEGVNRNIISRAANTAKLPRPFIQCLPSPNDLSARKGDELFKKFEKLSDEKKETLTDIFHDLLSLKNNGEKKDAEDVIAIFETACAGGSEKPKAVTRPLGNHATFSQKGNKAKFELKDADPELLQRIEDLILKHVKQ